MLYAAQTVWSFSNGNAIVSQAPIPRPVSILGSVLPFQRTVDILASKAPSEKKRLRVQTVGPQSLTQPSFFQSFRTVLCPVTVFTSFHLSVQGRFRPTYSQEVDILYITLTIAMQPRVLSLLPSACHLRPPF